MQAATATVSDLAVRRFERALHARQPAIWDDRVQQATARVAGDDVVDWKDVVAELGHPPWLQTRRAEVVEHAAIGKDDAFVMAGAVRRSNVHLRSSAGRSSGYAAEAASAVASGTSLSGSFPTRQHPDSRLPKRNAEPVRRSQALMTTSTPGRRVHRVGGRR